MDSLLVTSEIVNPQNHKVEMKAIIESYDKSVIDTTELFDDGLHHDNNAADGLFGASWPVKAGERNYSIHITTLSLDSGDNIVLCNIALFTTLGPVVLAHPFGRAIGDELPEPDDLIKLRLNLKNYGANATAENVKGRIVCSNEFVSITSDEQSFGDITSGMIEENSGYFRFEIDKRCPEDEILFFRVDISSNDYVFWSDSFEVHIGIPVDVEHQDQQVLLTYTLCQNYPNPFNPKTQIEFSLPKPTEVKLEVFDTAGRLVTILANQRFEQGVHELVFDGLDYPSGLYVFRLTTPDFTQQRKMILMK